MSSTKPDFDLRLPRPALLRPPWSITGRLTVLYVGSTAALLLVASGFLYYGLKESLGRQDDAIINGKLQVVQMLLRDHPDKPDALASELEHEALSNQVLKHYLRILDTRGRVLMETPGMSAFLPVMVFPAPPGTGGETSTTMTRTVPPDQHYRLATKETAIGAGATERRILQGALDVAHNEILLADYRWKLLVALSVGTLLAAIAGIGVTHAGLRPLAILARTTQRITASKLDERLASDNWPVELQDFAVAFDAMLDRLQDSFRRLEAFSADIAHAMRNPINNLRGETEVALTRARTPEEYRHTMASTLEELERLSRMTEALLFIARADNPQTSLERVAFDARREMDAVREFYEALASEHHVTVECAGNAPLVGNPMLVRRAVSNLLANALKYTPAGGRIALRATPRPDGSVEITVTDTGEGIAAEHLPHVFDRFFQVNKTQASTTHGAGLGLAIVQTIMRLHGGTASIASTPGQGTTVTLVFPRGESGQPVRIL